YEYINMPSQESYVILGSLQDSDGDGLSDAYENLVSKTNPNNPDTDGDGLSDWWEVTHGMNPLVDESAQTSGRRNYQYNGAGWLRAVTGIWTENITLDADGRMTSATNAANEITRQFWNARSELTTAMDGASN